MDPGLVRSALERAVAVAREGEHATPSVPAPKELTPYLTFNRLTGPALVAVLRVLDTDTEFRGRVLAATTADQVDAAGWLALTRPAGWQELLEEVAAARTGTRTTEEGERRLRELARAVEVADDKRGHAEAELSQARDELDALNEELAAVRKERRRAGDALRTVERRVEELAQKVEDRETRLAEAQGAREAREHELAETRRLLDQARADLAERPAPPAAGERPVDVVALREATERLQRSATTLARAVDAVAATVPPPPAPADDAPATARRVPPTLPGGVVADSPDGARWLLGRPGVVVLVDGYNVAKQAWPDVALEDQRARLIRALDELALRTGAHVEVVFDGPPDAAPTARQSTRSVVVRYSGGALADDVVVDGVGEHPLEQPVVVVSDDREVREGARVGGAAVVGAGTLQRLFA